MEGIGTMMWKDERAIDWSNHPSYREIIRYASKGKPPPSKVVYQAWVELPTAVYCSLMDRAMENSQRAIEDLSRKRALQEVKRRFGSLERVAEFHRFYNSIPGLMLTIAVVVVPVALEIWLVSIGGPIAIVLAVVPVVTFLWWSVNLFHWMNNLQRAPDDCSIRPIEHVVLSCVLIRCIFYQRIPTQDHGKSA